jgi:hypothetical protein
VVFVDDAHLLDNGSAILLHQLALTRAATVLATVRSGEPAPDPVVALWKDGPAERIEIGILDDAAIEELLVSVLRGPVDAASVRQRGASPACPSGMRLPRACRGDSNDARTTGPRRGDPGESLRGGGPDFSGSDGPSNEVHLL